MPTDVDQIVQGWISHFWSADHALRWMNAEVETSMWLTPNTLLLGRIDAIGCTPEGEWFFGEWKTASPREKKTWKQVWRKNPQSLTYGVLVENLTGLAPKPCHRFTVRKAFKEIVPTYDHAWYSYSVGELAHWRAELIRIAEEIRTYRGASVKEPEPWPTNFQACFKYGVNYACPFFECACNVEKWEGKPKDALVRISHLEGERRLNASVHEGLVVLDATRVKTWLDCRERFHREYVDNVAVPANDALTTGIDFHTGIGEYYLNLVKEQSNG